MARWFKADLHIHSTLSPCGSLYMSPRTIVEEAKKRGLEVIAVTDHNACDNLVYVKRVADQEGVVLIPGMELQTEEEVHVLAYFPTLEEVSSFRDAIYPFLPDVKNDPDYFGDQVIVDEQENIVGFEEKLLINSLLISLDQCVEMIREFGGFPVPAHVDRETFSVIGHLGFIPEHLDFDAVEVSRSTTPEKALETWPELSRYTLITSSDAHYPEDIGAVYTEFYLESPSFEGLVECLRGEREGSVRPVSQGQGRWG